MNSSLELAMESLAASVGPGQHTGLPCPKCSTGTSDRALSMLVDGSNIKAVCHRATCGFKYINGAFFGPVDAVRPSRVRPYMGELHTLDEADLLWFMERFRLPRESLRELRKSDGRYMLPIVDPEGMRRGWVSRRPWEGSPLSEPGVVDISPKSLTYMENDEPVQSWTGQSYVRTRVIVEDQISALRVRRDTGIPCVAILGTGVNEEKVAELQRHTDHLLIALDSDATGQSFSIARKWGQAFETCRVIILKCDIKDSDVQTVKNLFVRCAFT